MKSRSTSFTNMKRFHILIFILLFFTDFSVGQTVYQLGLLPSVNINKRFQRDWSLNFKAESRQQLLKYEQGDVATFDYDYLLTDLSLTAGKRISRRSTLSGGYLMRVSESGIKNRFIQQLSLARRYAGYSLSHRFAADQTFGKDEDTEFRFRYRLSAEIALQGETVDPKEFFLKTSHEYLNSFRGNDYDLEIRTAGLLGYALTKSNKLEVGLEHRADSFIGDAGRNRFWIAINFFHSLP
jgi:hypothetical protein